LNLLQASIALIIQDYNDFLVHHIIAYFLSASSTEQQFEGMGARSKYGAENG